jgi:hypothetical protein
LSQALLREQRVRRKSLHCKARFLNDNHLVPY